MTTKNVIIKRDIKGDNYYSLNNSLNNSLSNNNFAKNQATNTAIL